MAVTIGAIPPLLAKHPKNLGSVQPEVIYGICAADAGNGSDSYSGFSAKNFFGSSYPGVMTLKRIVDDWLRQAIRGDITAQRGCIMAFSVGAFL